MRIALTALLLLPLAGCTSSASAAERSWPVRDFDTVDLKGAMDVQVHQGTGFSVRAEGDPELLAHLTATVDHRRLLIGWTKNLSLSWHNRHATLFVTMPRVAGAAISGAGTMTVDRADAPDFVADIGGAGRLRVAALRADHANLIVSGTGSVSAAGQTGHLEARVSGVGSIDAGALQARSAALAMSGAGELKARVDGPAAVSLSGVGSVTVSGHPACAISKSGLGSVRCG